MSAPSLDGGHRDPLLSLVDRGCLEYRRIVTALATKLGVDVIDLYGCARRDLVRGLGSPPSVRAMDAKRALSDSLVAAPDLATCEGDPAVDAMEAVEGITIDVVDVSVILGSSGAALPRGSAAVAVVVIDVDGRYGPDVIPRLTARAADAGLEAVHVGLVARPDGSARDRPIAVLSHSEDEGLALMLSGGIHGLRLDPALDVSSAKDDRARVCIATYEAVGPTRTGGIGTSYTSLACALAAGGHEVTLLFTGPMSADQARAIPEWTDRYAKQGVRFEVLGTPWRSPVRNPFRTARVSWELYRWLCAQEPYDVVHVPDTVAGGYHALLAKRLEGRFADTTFMVGIHSPTRWIYEANRQPVDSVEQLHIEYCERRCVELADIVFAPSAYMLDYLRDRGWNLPARVHVQQYVLPHSVRDRSTDEGSTARAPGSPREIVFFGRLEARKGLPLFCDALEVLAGRPDIELDAVTFLGRATEVEGRPSAEYIHERASRWPWPHRVVTDLDQVEATEYLRSRDCLVAMPSLVDNSPNTVYEALALRLPILVSGAGGTIELIRPEDVDRAVFRIDAGAGPGVPPEPEDCDPLRAEPEALADLIERRLREEIEPPRFAVDPEANERAWLDWHAAAAAARRHRLSSTRGRAARTASQPATTLIVHPGPDASRLYAGSDGLAHALDAGWEVIVACESHEVAEATAELAYRRRLDLGAVLVGPSRPEALNDAVAVAQSEHIVITDGSVALRRGEAPALANAIAASDERLLTMTVRDPNADPDGDPALEEAEPLRALDDEDRVLLPLSGPAVAVLATWCMHAGAIAFGRESLDALGGFAQEATGEVAELHLLVRALLDGPGIDTLPRPTLEVVAPGRAGAALAVPLLKLSQVPPLTPSERRALVSPFLRSLDPRSAPLVSLVATEPDRVAGLLRTQEAIQRWGDGLKEWGENLKRYVDELESRRDTLTAQLEAAKRANHELMLRLIRLNQRQPDFPSPQAPNHGH